MVGMAEAKRLVLDFKDDLIRDFGYIWTWLSGIGDKIIAAVGDLSKVLYHAGAAVIQGFWDGMKSVWGKAKDWLGGIRPDITDIKGPPAADAVALIKNGQLIMEGFQKGMQQGWDSTSRWLSGIAPSMSGVVGTSAGYGSGGGGTSIVVAQGAVQLSVGSVRSDEDLDAIEKIVNDKFAELVRELSQPTYGSNYG
jgi:hypothetical protein